MRSLSIALCLAACHAPPSAPATATTIVPAPAPASIEPPVIPSGTAMMVRPGATVWLDGSDARPLQLPDASGLAVRVVAGAGERIEVDTDTEAPCKSPFLEALRLRLFVARSDLAESATPCEATASNGAPAASAAAEATRVVRAGTQAFWRDGSRAGTAAHDYIFAAPPAAAGARTCFPFLLAPGDEITLCFATEAIAELNAVERAPTPNVLGSSETALQSAEIGGLLGSDVDSVGGLGLGDMRNEPGIGRKTATPIVRHGKAKVVGSLDKDIVRRIVRTHVHEIRFCYGKALERHSRASGEVAIRFTIDQEGRVVDALPDSSTIDDNELITCMLAHATRWKFPKPEAGGTVKVTYPFILAPK